MHSSNASNGQVTACTQAALVMWQAAPAAAAEKGSGRGTAAAAVQALQEEATPSHDVYGHLPKPEENDKVCGHNGSAALRHVVVT